MPVSRAIFAGAFAVASLACFVAGAQTPVAYTLETMAGSDFVGDGGFATTALINHLEGVAIDSRGNLYVADADDHRIRKITPQGIISTLAGTGHPGFSGDGGPAVAAQLRTPYGIAVDQTGNVYVADLGNARVRRIAADGRISTIAGGGASSPTQTEGRPATEAMLKAPRNIALDAYGVLYFSDFGDHRVFQVMPNGVLFRLAGTGEAGLAGDGGSSLLARLSSPAGLAVDSLGAVYVADSGNARIRKVFRGLITTLGDTGKPGASPSLPLLSPTGLAFDPDGSLYIADSGNAQILRVTPLLDKSAIAQPARDIAIDFQGNLYACTGSVVYKRSRFGGVAIVAGGPRWGFSGDGGPAPKARLNAPHGIARDAAGNLYVADTANHVIRKITPDLTISTVAGVGQPGFAGDGAAALTAQLNAPEGVAIDSAGNLVIADTGNHRIRKVDSAGVISTLAGTGEPGNAGDRGAARNARLNLPTGVAVDANGNLYIADTGNQVVRQVNGSGVILTVAGNGLRGYTGEGGAPLGASLDTPRGVAVDGNGNLYIADAGNRRVRRVSAVSAFGPSTIITIPDPNAAIWRAPAGIGVDDQGNVLLSDALDQRVFRMEPNGRITTIAGTGATGFSNDDPTAGLASDLDTPSGLVVDPAGNIFFTETATNRIRKLTPIYPYTPPPSLELPLNIMNAASLLAGPVAPGEIVSVFGFALGPDAPVSAASGVSVPTELGGTQVLFNGRPAPLFYVQAGQINLQVPYGTAGSTSADVQVTVNGLIRSKTTVGIAAAVPGIFTLGNGVGQVAAMNEDGSMNSENHPAARGSIITLFATGEGQTMPGGVDGQATSWPTPRPALDISLRIGDYPAEIVFAGEAPGFTGLLQVNARVPSGFAPPGVLSLTLQVGVAVSQPAVTVVVQ